MTIELFHVPGLKTQQMVHLVTQEVTRVPGVSAVRVNPSDHSVRVEHDGSAGVGDLIRAIQRAGFDEVFVMV